MASELICYDCGCRLRHGEIVRRTVATAWSSYPRGGATHYGRVSLCLDCDRAREKAARAADASLRSCLTTVLIVLLIAVAIPVVVVWVIVFAPAKQPPANTGLTTQPEGTEVGPPKPEPKPSPPATEKAEAAVSATVTLIPPSGGSIVLANHRISLSAATEDAAVRAKWSKEGYVRVLTEPTQAEVVVREKDVCRVKVAGKEWLVHARWVPK